MMQVMGKVCFHCARYVLARVFTFLKVVEYDKLFHLMQVVRCMDQRASLSLSHTHTLFVVSKNKISY